RRWSGSALQIAAGIGTGILAGVIGLSAFSGPRPSQAAVAPHLSPHLSAPARSRHFAQFGPTVPRAHARYLAGWVAWSADAREGPFLIVDKKGATLYAFDRDSRLLGASPILLGGAKGDDTVAGIGSRPIDQVRPEERTTPAGRFVGERGHDARG